jgi:two-component system, response regulator PdtaR
MNKYKIMIVEDESLTSSNLQNQLNKLGYEVTNVYSNAEDAIINIDKESPDLILMDLILDGKLSGIEAAKNIYIKYDIPIIFATSFFNNKIIDEAIKSNPFSYMIKPFTMSEIDANIKTALQKHKNENKLKEKEKQLRNMVDLLPIIICDLDKNFKITYLNRTGINKLCINENDINKGEYFESFIENEKKIIIYQLFRKILKNNESSNIKCLIKTKNGIEYPFLLDIIPISENNTQCSGLRLIMADIKDFNLSPIPQYDDFFNNYHLTEREIEISKLLIHGSKYKYISEKLCISISTVKTHIQNIYEKLSINNKDDLIKLLKKYQKDDKI